MAVPTDLPAAGIDACLRGWVAVLVNSDGLTVMTERALPDLIERCGSADIIGIDMPIGLTDAPRDCDVEARPFVGPRRNSVFMTPPADVILAETYEEANALARKRYGYGISRQAYALSPNIRIVERIASLDQRLIEVHPEVSFRALIGKPLEYAKTTWNGQQVRRSALRAAGLEPPELLDEAGSVPPADVLDAAAAAWSARRYAEGIAEALPRDARRGARPAIWY